VILFLALAKNCAGTLPPFFHLQEQLREGGIENHAIIGENGSRDHTRALLLSAQNVTHVPTEDLAHVANRLQRMAIGREALLERARTYPGKEEFICVLDLDDVMVRPPDFAALIKAMQRLREDPMLFAVGATSKPYYYDLLALRAPGHDYSDLAKELRQPRPRLFGYYHFHRDHIYVHQRRLSTDAGFLCDSTFNGMCLYRSEDYFLGSYRSAKECDVCEHVTLNETIAAATQRKMLVSPELTVATPSEHAPLSLIQWYARRLGLRLRAV
jgi:hypothetical protein